MLRAMILCAVLILASHGLAQSQETALAPDVKVKDVWKYRRSDPLSQDVLGDVLIRIVRVENAEVVVQFISSRIDAIPLGYFTREMNEIDHLEMQFKPYYPALKFPMHVGAAWAMPYDFKQPTGFQAAGYIKGKVAAYEDVTVPAGTFKAFRVELEDERRVTGPGSVVAQEKTKLWYAPKIKNYVRKEIRAFRDGRERQGQLVELLEYSLADDPETAAKVVNIPRVRK